MTLLPALLVGLAAAVLLGARLPATQLPVPLAAGGAGLLLSPSAAVVGVLLAVAGTRAWRQRELARADADERSGAVEGVVALAAELRAGRSPGEALSAAATVATGPFAVALAASGRAAALGADPALVLRDRAGSSAAGPALRALAACLQVCSGSGASLAAATETVATSLRADEEQRLEVAAELAGPRATATMLALLPVAGLLLAAGLGARPLHVLLHTPYGGACLVLGVLLDLLGLWWTQRLVAGAVR